MNRPPIPASQFFQRLPAFHVPMERSPGEQTPICGRKMHERIGDWRCRIRRADPSRDFIRDHPAANRSRRAEKPIPNQGWKENEIEQSWKRLKAETRASRKRDRVRRACQRRVRSFSVTAVRCDSQGPSIPVFATQIIVGCIRVGKLHRGRIP